MRYNFHFKMKIKRFDKIEYAVLTCAHPTGMGYYPNDPHKSRALLLMKEGIITKVPYKDWQIHGWSLTKKGTEYHDEFIKKLRTKHGHEWEAENGRINWFALSEGFHNGPRCKKCNYSFCHHCKSEFDVDPCLKK